MSARLGIVERMASQAKKDKIRNLSIEAQRDAEEALLGWQLRGEIGATEAVRAELGSATELFFTPYNRIQEAIFAAERQKTSTSPSAIALQLAADEALDELGGIEFLGTMAAAAPAIVDVIKSIHATAESWRKAKQHRLFTLRTEEVLDLFHGGDPSAFSELQSAGREASEAITDSSIVATPYSWRDPETIPRRQWVFSRHAARRFVSVTAAAGGAGKTALAFADALSVCSGRPLLNDGAVERCRVWYMGLEDPLEEYQRRIAAAALHHRLRPSELGSLFLDSARDQNFVIAREAEGGSIILEPIVRGIIAQIRRHSIGLVIVDPFVNCHELNEQDNSKIGALMKQWAHIADETGCAIELLHHTRKANGASDDDSADEVRGAGAFVNAARSVRRLARMTKDEAARSGVDDRRRFFRVIPGAKANLTLHSDEAQWRELVSIDLGNGDADHPADRVQAVAAWRFPDAANDCSQDQLGAIIECLRSGTYRESSQAKEWAGNAVAGVLGLDLSDEGAKASIKSALRKWAHQGRLKVIERGDEKARKIFKFIVPAD
ncbi:MAG TPA: AAA family ATPase [Rhizomicrobium sp.]|jgi:hypothetical protein|nr:AAA family ATPase [Rhizomicrobium sp.]